MTTGRRAKLIAVACAFVALVVAVQILPVSDWLDAALGRVEQLGPAGPAVFALLYFLATVLVLPGWPLSVAAGVLFGLVTGTVVVVVGATAGAAGAFLLARYLARGLVESRLRNYPRFAAVDRAVGEGGWRIVLLLRLSPAFPFNLQNFGYGLTAIRFWPCTLATAVGILPGTFMYVYLGHAGRAGIGAAGAGADGSLAEYALLVVGLVATVAVTVYITYLARNAIRRHITLVDDDRAAPAATAAPTDAFSSTRSTDRGR